MYKKTYLYKFLLFFIVACCSLSTLAQSIIPSPTNDKYINDYVGVMSQQGKNHIIQTGEALEYETSAQVIVAIVPSTNNLPIEDFAIRLFRSWGIGQADQDNGLLILLSVDDQKWRIEVGRGLEGTIPDVLTNRIMNEVAKPEFIKGNYEQGLINAYDAFTQLIAEDVGTKPISHLSSNVTSLAPIIIVLFVLDLIFNRGRIFSTFLQLLFISSYRSRGPWGGHSSGGFGNNNKGGKGGFGGGSSNGGGSSGGW